MDASDRIEGTPALFSCAFYVIITAAHGRFHAKTNTVHWVNNSWDQSLPKPLLSLLYVSLVPVPGQNAQEQAMLLNISFLVLIQIRK